MKIQNLALKLYENYEICIKKTSHSISQSHLKETVRKLTDGDKFTGNEEWEEGKAVEKKFLRKGLNPKTKISGYVTGRMANIHRSRL